MSLTQELKKQEFEKLWQRYPNKDGKKQAWTHYNRSIKTYPDIQQITLALENYIAHLRQEDWKKPKSGSTWFNNWQDWIKPFVPNELTKTTHSEPLTPERIKDIKMRFSQAFQTKLQLKYRALRMQSIKLLQLKHAPCNMW